MATMKAQAEQENVIATSARNDQVTIIYYLQDNRYLKSDREL